MKVCATAKFPLMKPAHHAYINKTGEGGNFFIAARNALLEIQKDVRLKGKRTSNTSPMTVTFAVYIASEDEAKD